MFVQKLGLPIITRVILEVYYTKIRKFIMAGIVMLGMFTTIFFRTDKFTSGVNNEANIFSFDTIIKYTSN